MEDAGKQVSEISDVDMSYNIAVSDIAFTTYVSIYQSRSTRLVMMLTCFADGRLLCTTYIQGKSILRLYGLKESQRVSRQSKNTACSTPASPIYAPPNPCIELQIS